MCGRSSWHSFKLTPEHCALSPVLFLKETIMADDRNEWTNPQDEDEAEIKYLVENTDLSPLQAKELVAKHGADREKLLEIARTMQAEG